MIINTGMRTDIPAFYSEWFMNRIRDGFAAVRNPYRPDWITRYELSPDVVDCIAFCTKNPFQNIFLDNSISIIAHLPVFTIYPDTPVNKGFSYIVSVIYA